MEEPRQAGDPELGETSAIESLSGSSGGCCCENGCRVVFRLIPVPIPMPVMVTPPPRAIGWAPTGKKDGSVVVLGDGGCVLAHWMPLGHVEPPVSTWWVTYPTSGETEWWCYSPLRGVWSRGRNTPFYLTTAPTSSALRRRRKALLFSLPKRAHTQLRNYSTAFAGVAFITRTHPQLTLPDVWRWLAGLPPRHPETLLFKLPPAVLRLLFMLLDIPLRLLPI